MSRTGSEGLLRGTWEDLADGRPHRLKLGKHFDMDVREIGEYAAAAAHRMGKAVRTLRDELGRGKTHYLWVQFADQELPLGARCAKCGSTTVVRLHEHFGRCPACEATIAFKGSVLAQDRPSFRPGERLSGFTMARLVARDEDACTADNERWYGFGRDPDGRAVLLQVDYRLRDGERTPDPLMAGDDAHRVRRWALRPFVRAHELGVLGGWTELGDLVEDDPED